MTLPLRRSNAYVAWLVIEIGRLAVHLRDVGALDAAGEVQLQMAKDLADTTPAVMLAAITLARRESIWLPKTKELLEFYARAAKRQQELDAQAEQAAEDAERRALLEERRLHPEEFFDLNAVVQETAPKFDMRRPRHVTPAPTPRVQDCPHCGMRIPFEIRDFSALTSAELRSMADHRQQAEERVQTARERFAEGEKEARETLDRMDQVKGVTA